MKISHATSRKPSERCTVAPAILPMLLAIVRIHLVLKICPPSLHQPCKTRTVKLQGLPVRCRQQNLVRVQLPALAMLQLFRRANLPLLLNLKESLRRCRWRRRFDKRLPS